MNNDLKNYIENHIGATVSDLDPKQIEMIEKSYGFARYLTMLNLNKLSAEIKNEFDKNFSPFLVGIMVLIILVMDKFGKLFSWRKR